MGKWEKIFLIGIVSLLSLAAAASEGIVFVEDFSSDSSKWIPSQATKLVSQEEKAKYDGTWDFNFPTKIKGEFPSKGLLLQSASKHHAISTKLPQAFEFDPEKEFVLQYEVKLQNQLNCGGAYIKLLSASDNYTPENFDDKAAYTIMFGPDKCGATNKVHLIFRVKNPITGEISEKHLSVPPTIKNEGLSDLYTLIVKPDNTFKILINLEEAASGSLLEKFTPPFVPPKTIDDPTDSKPADWVDEAKISDPDARKPDDWDEDAPPLIDDEAAVKPSDWLDDEPLFIPDPSIEKPSDWNEEDDGDWEAPSIENPKCKEVSGCGEWTRPTKRNPAYKGKWKAPLIDNPAYKGPWKARQIPNPEYYEEPHPNKFTPIGAIGFELWTLQDGILFDNILIATNEKVAIENAEKTWRPKYESEKVEKEKFASKDSPSSFQEFFETLVERLTDFYIGFSEDPIEALKANPTITILLVLIPALVFLLVFAALSPSPAPIPRRPIPAEPTPVQEGSETESENKGEESEAAKEK